MHCLFWATRAAITSTFFLFWRIEVRTISGRDPVWPCHVTIIVYIFNELLYSARHNNDKILPTLLFFIWAASHHLNIFTFPLFPLSALLFPRKFYLVTLWVFFVCVCGFSLTRIHNDAEYSLLITKTKNTTVMRQAFRFLLPLFLFLTSVALKLLTHITPQC